MSDIEQLKIDLDLTKPDACGSCFPACRDLNVGAEDFLCLRAIAANRYPTRNIDNPELLELLESQTTDSHKVNEASLSVADVVMAG